MALNYDMNKKHGELVIDLEGDLDIYSCTDFKETVNNEVIKNPADILIEAKDLDYIDSTGLGVLISIYKHIKESGHNIAIKDLKPNVKKIFLITDLDKIFDIKE